MNIGSWTHQILYWNLPRISPMILCLCSWISSHLTNELMAELQGGSNGWIWRFSIKNILCSATFHETRFELCLNAFGLIRSNSAAFIMHAPPLNRSFIRVLDALWWNMANRFCATYEMFKFLESKMNNFGFGLNTLFVTHQRSFANHDVG